MNQQALDTAVQHLKDFPDLIPNERKYKLEDSSKLHDVLAAVLEGKSEWAEFFRRGNKFLRNQLGWRTAEALDHLSKSKRDVLTLAVRNLLETCDADRFWESIEEGATEVLNDEKCKPLRGAGGRASVASFFLLLQDPTNHPIFRPNNVGAPLHQITGIATGADTPGATLDRYYQALDLLKEKLAESGLPVQDRLDVQGAVWSAKFALNREDDETEAKATYGAAQSERANDGSLRTPDATLPGDLVRHLSAQGLHYGRDLLATYLAALMTKGFVILSGLSGSGKTRLALDAGRYLGEAKLVPVRPDWTDSKGAFGYLNPLTGSYQRTAALDFILEARLHPDVPYVLVLDEMNLAHVERYFADVLSAIESGEAIPLHDDERVEESQGVPRHLRLPSNLLIVGTVNVDETAYPFSPKVLDRAFVIDMSRVSLAGYLGNAQDEAASVAKPAPVALTPSRKWREIAIEEDDQEWLLGIHEVFDQHGWPFGYRVADEALAFLAHARLLGLGSETARDSLLCSKMLPKLHGNRARLEPLVGALQELLSVELGTFAGSYERSREQLRLIERQLEGEGYAAALG